ncbi:hypothetical protein [Cognatitamlana onchidii]|uniref:hypothetical protein n=1 Tax=Cognatitamlana onchidii TaxID=2562860 RepID=UPI0010A5F328|nr:hypothetical protein [Algibacter onchidii]
MKKESKKTLKIISGIIIFCTLPSILLFGFFYFKYNEKLPEGNAGAEADNIALKMLQSLDYTAFKTTPNLEWTFKKRRHYELNKKDSVCTVYWGANKVVLDLKDINHSKVYIHSFKNESDMAKDLIEKAFNYFANDAFWVLAPYMVFDKGTIRKTVSTLNSGRNLLVTYKTGDSFLWLLDENFKPKSFKMWTSQLPIDGLEASWTDWTTTETGVQLPTFHKFLFFGMEITDIKSSY